MRKVIIFYIILLCSLANISAQECTMQPFEGEVYAGLSIPLGGYHGGKTTEGAALGVAFRYNPRWTLPISYGAMIQLDCARRNFANIYNSETANRSNTNEIIQNNRTLTIGISVDYYFRQCTTISPYIGMGFGVGFQDVVGEKLFPSKGTSFVAMPRIGVEFWHILRVNCYAQLSRQGFNNLGLGLGLCIGGRRAKN